MRRLVCLRWGDCSLLDSVQANTAWAMAAAQAIGGFQRHEAAHDGPLLILLDQAGLVAKFR